MTAARARAHPRAQVIVGISLISPRSAIVCAMVAAAIVLGGGGSSAPLSETILEVIIAIMAAAWLFVRRTADRACPRSAAILAGLLVVLPVLQLIPLPPEVWQRLPGRAVEADALGLVGARSAWMPWTISPARTWAALIAIAPPAFVLIAASMLDRAGRRALLVTIAIMGVASLLLGALQLADGIERTWRFYDDNPGFLNGFQANRNAEADVLLIAFAALVGLVDPNPRDDDARSSLNVAIVVGGGLSLLLGCVLTGSRAGIALTVPLVLLALIPWRTRLARGAGRAMLVAVPFLVLGCVVLVQRRGEALGLVIDRFTWSRDVRADLWRDTLPILRSVWPIGSGLGTFRPMFIAGEPLTSVDPTFPVRAHNDYLEIVLEGGIAAVVIVAAYVVAVMSRFMRARRVASARDGGSLGFIAATGLIIAAHSLVDYPLRSMAIAILGAAASGMLIGIVRDGSGEREARAAA